MKTVTDAFEAVQLQASATIVRQVYYKRRYWNPSTRAYAWEASWTQLGENEILSVSPVVWNLDTDQLNEFKVSNVTITVDNSDNKWRSDNPYGIFAKDSASNLYPYEPYWMKFQVKAGFVLADGTTETISVFTGLATDYTLNATGKTCQVSVQGLEALLVGTKAESIATTVTEENAGSGNGVTTAFTTLNPGVGGVTEVSVAGIKQLEGSVYTVSNLNSSSLGATVTFTVAPVSGTIRISYFYWPQSQKFETLVASLVTAAGISGGNQSIEPVLFSNSVLNTQTYTTKADWDAGTNTRTDNATANGSVGIDWTSANFMQSTTWSQALTGWSDDPAYGGSKWTSDGTYLSLGSGGITYIKRTVATPNRGGFQFKYTFDSTANIESLYVGLVVSTFYSSPYPGSDPVGFTGPYMVVVMRTATDTYVTWNGSSTYRYRVGNGSDTAEHTVKCILSGNNQILIYVDGVLQITGPVNGFNVKAGTSNFAIGRGSGAVVPGLIKVREIQVANDSTAQWQSGTIDAGSTPTAWGQFEINYSNDFPDTLLAETRTSTDGISWDAWTATSGSAVLSTLRRYIQVRFTITTVSSSTGTSFAAKEVLVTDVTIRWTTSSTLVTLPVFTGDDVYTAIQKLGEYTNYEFGFTPDEVFFFRQKTPDASVFSMDQSNYISSVPSMDNGHSRVYGVVRATYGSITKEVTDDGLAPESATARFKNRRYEISPDSNIIIPATADIATGVAQSLFSYVSRPRKRFKVITHFLPQLDLSDVVTVSLDNNWPDKVWYIGDDNPDIYIGNQTLDLWGDTSQFVSSMTAKIISARYDTQQRSCEFELEEIL